MKTKYFNKTGILAVCSLGLVASIKCPTANAEQGKLEYSGNLDLGVGAVATNGNGAALQRRMQNNGDFFGGLSNFRAESEIGDVTYTLDGRAVFGTNDYEFVLGAVKEDVGYLEIGYREFTTFYDGSGGYLPTNVPSFYPIADDSLELDRGEVWLEAGLRLKDQPEYTFRYTHSWRDGEKDSTMWSRPGTRGIASTYYAIDETRDVFELDVTHTIGNTDLGLGMNYEILNNDNDRVFDGGANRQTDASETDLFNAHASSVSRINDKMMFSFGYAFTTLSSDTYVTRTNSILNYTNGGADQKSHVTNMSFWWNPIEDLVIAPSIRAVWNEMDGQSSFWYDGNSGDGYANPFVDVDGNTLTEEIEARYQGIENVLLYAKATLEQEEENTDWSYYQDYPELVGNTPVYALSGTRFKECDANRNKGAVGATWYATKGLSFAAEYYRKEAELNYDTLNWGTGVTHFGDAHISKLETSTDDINLRVTWRARPDLTLVTRYDWQVTNYDMTGFDGTLTVLPEIESGEFERNVISESATYLISENMYMQGLVSYTWSETESAASIGRPDIVSGSDNDYLTASVGFGYALNEKTDITIGYSYFLAENFTVPSGSVAYGTDLEEHMFNVGVSRRLSENMLLNLGYAYITSNDGTSGGNNDFDAHMISSGLQVRF